MDTIFAIFFLKHLVLLIQFHQVTLKLILYLTGLIWLLNFKIMEKGLCVHVCLSLPLSP